MAERGGQPGNDNATKTRPFWATVTRAIAQDDGKRLRDAAEKLLDEAAKGESWALAMLADRLDGKPHQSVALADPDGSSQLTQVARLIIDAATKK